MSEPWDTIEMKKDSEREAGEIVTAAMSNIAVHNDVLRSALSIAEREGAETNWKAFWQGLKPSTLVHICCFPSAVGLTVRCCLRFLTAGVTSRHTIVRVP